MKKNRYEVLMYKSELAALTARKSETDWACWYWQNVADYLKKLAYLLNVEAL